MRGSGWALPIIAAALFLAAVAYPAGMLAVEVRHLPRTAVEAQHPLKLLLTTSLWSIAIALGAVALGWAPGRLLGKALARRGSRGFVPLAAAMLAPICLPAYVVFWTWYQAWDAPSPLFAWAARNDHLWLLRWATLYLGMLCWSWPIVAWCVAGSVAATPAERDELLALDGAGPLRRMLDHLRCDVRGLALGGLIVCIAAFNNTTCFDLAQVFTFGYELRAIDSLGASAKDMLITSSPAVALAAAGAIVIWLALAGRPREPARRASLPGRGSVVLTSLIWMLSVAGPVILLARSFLGGRAGYPHGAAAVREFMDLYGGAPIVDTVSTALVCGLLTAAIALGLGSMWLDPRRWVRAAAHVQAVGWFIAGLVPGSILGVAQELAYNRGLLARAIYAQPIIMVIGYLGCFGFIGAMLGRWWAAREPRALRDLRQLDGAISLRGLTRSSWPAMLAAGGGALAIVSVLSMAEIPVTARLRSPGFEPLAGTILNAMHYQQPQTVMVASLAMIALALLAAVLVAALFSIGGRLMAQRAASALLVVVIALGAGCGERSDRPAQPLEPVLVFGSTGSALGQFSYPRAMTIDDAHQFVYVVDKTARVQRFGFDGKPQAQWQMPARDNGKPTGVSVAPDGRVFVADTHYFRVVAFDRDGNELMRFGEYGTEPGQFIFPTDIAFAPDGRIFVSEYGGNDRIQAFDASGNFLFAFGQIGSAPGQFARPQAIAFSRDGRELFVADACNHRIQVFDPADGRLLRMFGGVGQEPGRLSYPYGVMVLDDGTLLVAEFGSNRVQHFSPQGQSLGVFGMVGAGPGCLRYPWAVDVADGRIFILDSGNNRVQVIEEP